ncbi:MAG: Ger(x)C family spore germination protein [Clostridia bacterium]
MKKLLFLIFCISFLLIGCQDYVEVENLTIVTAVAIDKAEENEQGYKISVEIVKFESDQTNTTIVEAQGETFAQAINNAVKITGNDLYFSHAQAIIISEEVASESIYEFIDYAYRNTDFRLNTDFLVSKDAKASEILSANSLIDDIAGVQIKKMVDSNELISQVPAVPIYEFIDDVSTEGICGILPVVTLVTDQNEENLREISGIAVFDEEYICGYLDENQTKMLAILQNETEKGVLLEENAENTYSFNLISAKTEIIPKYENGEINFYFDVKMKVELIQQNWNFQYENQQNLLEIQKNIANTMQNNINMLINEQKNSGLADFLGLGNMVYRKYPELWKTEISQDYENFIKNLNYTLNVDCEIVGTGLVSSPIIIEK